MRRKNFNMKVRAAGVALFATTMMLTVSCGGNTNKKQAADGATETATEAKAPSAKGGAVALKDVSADNWQAAIKSNFRFDFALPDGWTFKSAESPNGRSNMKLFLNIGGATTGEEMGKQLFAQTAALSSHGNYKGVPDWDNDKVDAGGVLNDFASSCRSGGEDIISQWCFTSGSTSVMVNYYTMKNQIAEYTFTINSTKP